MSPNTKKILIETESREVFRLRIIGPEIARLYCERCEKIEEMLDLNSAADISGAAARGLLQRIESGELHSPDDAGGHLLICRRSLEWAINQDENLRPQPFAPELGRAEKRDRLETGGDDRSSAAGDRISETDRLLSRSDTKSLSPAERRK